MSIQNLNEQKNVIKYDFQVKSDNTEVKNDTKCNLVTKCVPIKPYMKQQFKIVFCLSFCHLLTGYTIGWSAPVIPKLQNIEETPLNRVITDPEASWVACIFMLTNIILTNVIGYISNIIGRKTSLILCEAVMFVGYALSSAATDLNMIYVGRILAGVGLAPAMVMDLIYIGEIATPNIRGMITAIGGILHVLGGLLVYSVGPFVSYADVSYVALFLNAISIALMFLIPESPVFYVNKGKIEKAKAVLRQLERREDIDTELKLLISNNSATGSHNARILQSWIEIFTKRINRRSLAITGMIYALQEASGAVTILFFATNIFKNAKSSVEPHICTILLGVTELCGVIVTPPLIDRCGRRKLLSISSLGCSLTMAILGIHAYLDHIQHPVTLSLGWLPLVTLVLFVLIYNSGLSIVPNTLISEMFTPLIRGTGSSLSLTIGILACFITNLAFGYMNQLGYYVSFWVFAGINAFTFVYTFIVVPETKGKSLMEIQEMLAK